MHNTHTHPFPSHIKTPNQRLRTWVEICRARTQSASAIRHRTHRHTHSRSHTWRQLHKEMTKHTHVKSSELTDERKAIALFRLPHHNCNQHTCRGGGMEVAILRACAPVLFRRWLWACWSGNWVHIQMPFSSSTPRSLQSSHSPTSNPRLSAQCSPWTWLHFRLERGVKQLSSGVKKRVRGRWLTCGT